MFMIFRPIPPQACFERLPLFLPAQKTSRRKSSKGNAPKGVRRASLVFNETTDKSKGAR